MLDEDLPHRPGGHGEEVLAVLPVDVMVTDELQVGLVHEFRRAEGDVLALPAELSVGKPPKLVVDRRQKLIQGRLLPVAQAHEQGGDVDVDGLVAGHRG